MKLRHLTFFIVLSILLLVLQSTIIQAKEYELEDQEVAAEVLLTHIEKGDDIHLNNCSIVGDLYLNESKFKTVPNPRYHEGIPFSNKNLKVITGKIDIVNSIFVGGVDFSYALFVRNIFFYNTTFGRYANFNGVFFKEFTFFEKCTFENYADFDYAFFEGITIFKEANFKSDTSFFSSSFENYSVFNNTTFNGFTDFNSVSFNASSNNRAEFDNTKFKHVSLKNADIPIMKIRWKSLENSLVYDEIVYSELIKYYKSVELYEDADAAYYQYRMERQAKNPWISFHEKIPWISFPKVGDIFMWLTCGYGVKPAYTILSSILMVLLFSAIYIWEDLCLIGLSRRFDHKTSEILVIISRFRVSRGKNVLNFSSWGFYLRALFHWRVWDALYFSIASFTNTNYKDWEPEKYSRKLAVLEGFIGNLFIALFIVTLVNVLIRPQPF